MKSGIYLCKFFQSGFTSDILKYFSHTDVTNQGEERETKKMQLI